MRSNFSVGRAWEPLEIFKKYIFANAVRLDYQPLFEKELGALPSGRTFLSGKNVDRTRVSGRNREYCCHKCLQWRIFTRK